MGVRLQCTSCGQEWLSALFYRGPGQQVCKHCGGHLELADPGDDRRTGTDRRALPRLHEGPDWRTGQDRRESAPVAS
jgi:hypothetical protein